MSCVLSVTADRTQFTLCLKHGDNVIREKTLYTVEAAAAEAEAWQNRMITAWMAATSPSTPYDVPGRRR
jgi:hypothetical protein